MANPWAAPPSSDRGDLTRAHDRVVGERRDDETVRRLVRESWRRSLDFRVDPDRMAPPLELGDDELRAYRAAHPLSLALPTIHRLLIRHTFDAGLLVAVGDNAGRLLWIDGDRGLRRRAEDMLFVEGADWSERAVGTSAPGTALALDHGIQISQAEHFGRIVHPWSCTAVPVHDPATGEILGVIDITGGDEAVAPATLPLLEAAVAVVESELRLQRLDAAAASRPTRTRVPRPNPTLEVLGRDAAELVVGADRRALGPRHSEIMTLLAWHRGGLSAERLGELLYGPDASPVTLRAEMVRLRQALPVALQPLSKPYRLPVAVELDVHRVIGFLDRGAHKVALGAYPGPLLPRSDAPGIVAIRDEVRILLREAMLAGASVDTLLEYARSEDGTDDLELWRACLRLLPPRSPKRTAVVSRIERLEQEQVQPPLQP
jgi:hypothetical protein